MNTETTTTDQALNISRAAALDWWLNGTEPTGFDFDKCLEENRAAAIAWWTR